MELVTRSERPVAHVTAELGIGSESLRKAVRAAEAESGEQPDLPTKQELQGIRRLKPENDELRRTNEAHARRGSSRGWLWSREWEALVVEGAGGQAMVQTAQEPVEQVSLPAAA